MATTTDASYKSLEKEASIPPPSPPLESLNPLEKSDPSLDQNAHPALDDTGIEAPTEPAPPLIEKNDDGELPLEPPVERPMAQGNDYSCFSVTQKRLMLVTVSFASLFSPMATAIYCEYPIPTLMR